MRSFKAARAVLGAPVVAAAAVFVAAVCFQSCGGGGGGGGFTLSVTQPGQAPTPLPQAAPGQGTSGPLTIIPGVTITGVCRPDAAKPRELHIKGSGLTASLIGNVIEGTSERPLEVLSVAQDGKEALVRLPETPTNQIELKLVVTDGKIFILSFDLSTVPACTPTIGTITPDRGSLNGGTNLTIMGEGFASNATVTVAGLACTNVQVASETQITCTTPAGPLGPADVTVTNPGSPGATKTGAFTYEGVLPNRQASDNTASTQDSPAVAVQPSGAICVVWRDDLSGTNIRFSRSTDGGTTWSPSVRVDPASGECFAPAIAVEPSTGAIVVVWAEGSGVTELTTTNIRYARSMDNGAIWVQAAFDVCPGTNPFNRGNPAIAIDSMGASCVVWSDRRSGTTFQIFFARSTDFGASAWANVRVDRNNLGGGAFAPSIVAEPGGALDVAWIDARNHTGFDEGCPNGMDVFFSRSTDQGVNWLLADVRVNSAPISGFVNFNQINAGNLVNEGPSLALGAGGIVCVFGADQECAAGAFSWPGTGPTASRAVYFTKSMDSGGTWSAEVKVNNDDTDGGSFHRRPKVALNGGSIEVVWIGRDATLQQQAVYRSHSTDSGGSWTARQRIDDGPNNVIRNKPGLAKTPSSGMIAVWQDARNGGNADIFSTRFQ